MNPVNVCAKFEVCIALLLPEIIAIDFQGGGCKPQILGKGSPYGVADIITVRKGVGEFL